MWRFLQSRVRLNFRGTSMPNEKGFTLIEAVVSIVLAGIVVTVAGMAVVRGMQGYVFTRENNAISQKARLVMARMSRELMELSAIDTGNSNDSCIRYKIETVSSFFRAIGLNNGNIELKISSTVDCNCPSSGDAGDILIDHVDSFTIDYEDQNGTTSSTPPSALSDLRAIAVNFSVDRTDTNTSDAFGITINPRNNRL